MRTTKKTALFKEKAPTYVGITLAFGVVGYVMASGLMSSGEQNTAQLRGILVIHPQHTPAAQP